MADLPQDKVAEDQVKATEFNLLRDLGFIVDKNAGETINGATLPVAVYFDNTDDEWKACDGNDADKLEFGGFAITNAIDGGAITVQISGRITGFSGLTIGAKYYIQDDKTIGTSVGTNTIVVGQAISATDLVISGNGLFQKYVVDTFVSLFSSGIAQRGFSSASGDQVIAHGLGKTPKKVRISAYVSDGGSTDKEASSMGSYDGTNNVCVFVEQDNNGDVSRVGSDGSNAVVMILGTNGNNSQKAVITVDGTNITLTWVKVGTGTTATIKFMWEAKT